MKKTIKLLNGKNCELDIYESYVEFPQIVNNNFSIFSFGTCIFITENIKNQMSVTLKKEIEEKSLDRIYINGGSFLLLEEITSYRLEIALYDNENNNEFLKKNGKNVKYSCENNSKELKKDDYIYYYTSILNYPLSWLEFYLSSNKNFYIEFKEEDIELNYSNYRDYMKKFKQKKEKSYMENKLSCLFDTQEERIYK